MGQKKSKWGVSFLKGEIKTKGNVKVINFVSVLYILFVSIKVNLMMVSMDDLIVVVVLILDLLF